MKYLQKYLGVILLVIACSIGLTNYDDYGICYDENMMRGTGFISAKYVLLNDQELLTWQDRDYGVAFELPLVIIEKALGLKDSRSVFLMRHLVSHLFFLISAFFCFLLIDLLYKNKWLATIGFLMIVLHPRLYAHSFFNTKDIPFMSMLLICLYLNAIALGKKKFKYFVLLGIGVGLLINMRIMGVLLFCLILFFLMIDFIKGKNYGVNIKLGLLFIFTSLTTLYISWPFLWIDPFENFVFAFQNMSKFRWEGSLLFNGQLIKGTEIGWNYIPVWFTITTPIFYLTAGLLGSILLVFKFIKAPKSYLSNGKLRNNLFFLICFLSPVVVVIALHSVLYDGWRQLYFIYPGFVLLCIYGLNFLFENNMKKLVVIISLIAFIYIGFFMVKNHPFQQVYFNEFVDHKTPEHLRKQFDLDYWGPSYKQSVEYILRHDHDTSINVYVDFFSGPLIVQIIPVDERQRLNFVKREDESYFITNYRWHPLDYEDLKQNEWHSIKVGNNSINTIFKLK